MLPPRELPMQAPLLTTCSWLSMEEPLEVLLLLLSPFLYYSSLQVTILVNSYSFNVGGSLASDDLFLLDLRNGEEKCQWMIVPVVGSTPGRRFLYYYSLLYILLDMGILLYSQNQIFLCLEETLELIL